MAFGSACPDYTRWNQPVRQEPVLRWGISGACSRPDSHSHHKYEFQVLLGNNDNELCLSVLSDEHFKAAHTQVSHIWAPPPLQATGTTISYLMKWSIQKQRFNSSCLEDQRVRGETSKFHIKALAPMAEPWWSEDSWIKESITDADLILNPIKINGEMKMVFLLHTQTFSYFPQKMTVQCFGALGVQTFSSTLTPPTCT